MSEKTVRTLPFPMNDGEATLHYTHPMSSEDYEWMLEVLRKMQPRLTEGYPCGTYTIKDAEPAR